ncbi:uncharacterized protein LOC113295175 [Papaver somniferum]|uniref:uncharacterized protein LOC113295175 n=1 Tax=Papaver somniferum TaxID=3469 RepID=UPI000E702420|nr:uncharacterized protein LOC113295175 [Papaver somniferum]
MVQAIPRIKIFVWKLAGKALPTSSRLGAHNPEIDPNCQLCNSQVQETENHLFRSCPFARAIWFRFSLGNLTSSANTYPITSWVKGWLLNPDLDNLAGKISTILWFIWKYRCSVVQRPTSALHAEAKSLQKSVIWLRDNVLSSVSIVTDCKVLEDSINKDNTNLSWTAENTVQEAKTILKALPQAQMPAFGGAVLPELRSLSCSREDSGTSIEIEKDLSLDPNNFTPATLDSILFSINSLLKKDNMVSRVFIGQTQTLKHSQFHSPTRGLIYTISC